MQNTPGHGTEGAASVLAGTCAPYKNSHATATPEAFRAIGLDGYAVQIIAARYQLSHPVAQTVAELAAIGRIA